MKTGALIKYACEAGAAIGKASTRDRQATTNYGRLVGEAFQLADDILDVTASTEKLGKKTAKDSDRGKPTLVASIGVDASRKRARDLAEEAIANLESFGQKAAHLKTAALFIVDRKY